MEKEEDEIKEIKESKDDDNEVSTLEEEMIKLREELVSVQEELRKAREDSVKNLTKLKYVMADFDNYRKQLEKQWASKIESNKAELILKFLNIRDDYLRGFEMAKQSKYEAVVIEGLEVILKNLDALLKYEGVMEIETTGTPFDPNIHDAITFSYKDDVPENTVTDEIRKGYMLNNKVLRPSLVEISKKIVKNTVNDTEKIEKETEN
ncbi:MAG: nucleotide exchange factor GrpE [Nitrososphaeraceae archaeon]